MAVRRTKARLVFNGEQTRRWLIASGLLAAVAAVLISPLMMVRLSSDNLPWGQLADVGQAYGGASAILSAVALCGVVASLLTQRQQARQELAEMDREHHRDLIELALDNPEFLEVLDAKTALGPYARQELYLNLVLMYWLAVWELGGIDDVELRAMTAGMFSHEVSRRWWARVEGVWIGTRGRRERRRFISIVSEELARARTSPAILPASAPRKVDDHCSSEPPARSRRRRLATLAAVAAAGGFCVVAAQSLRAGKRRIKPARGGRT